MNLDKITIKKESEVPTKKRAYKHNWNALFSAMADLKPGEVIVLEDCHAAARTEIARMTKERFTKLHFEIYGRTVDGTYNIYIKLGEG